MIDQLMIALLIVAALGAGGLVGLLSLIVMAIEIATED